MRGRFTQSCSWAEIFRFLNVLVAAAALNSRPRCNIAPTAMIDVGVDDATPIA
jgi:putative SOS response-associated peptidase YedK